jgi:hypothetical protein
MPGGVALLRWQRRDESGRGGIVEREKRQTLSAVEAGDGTRREAADPSVAMVEENRPSELARHDAILAGARSAALGWARRKRLVGGDRATRIASSKRSGRTTPINAAPRCRPRVQASWGRSSGENSRPHRYAFRAWARRMSSPANTSKLGFHSRAARWSSRNGERLAAPGQAQRLPTRRRAPTGPSVNDRDARARPARGTCPRARSAQAERR